jgi:hypothetical protein
MRLRRRSYGAPALVIPVSDRRRRRHLDKGGLRTDTPKSQAGKPAVAFPAEIASDIRWHFERFAEPGERGLVFVGPKGGKLRRSNFRKSVWSKARQQVGLPGLRAQGARKMTTMTARRASGCRPANGPLMARNPVS